MKNRDSSYVVSGVCFALLIASEILFNITWITVGLAVVSAGVCFAMRYRTHRKLMALAGGFGDAADPLKTIAEKLGKLSSEIEEAALLISDLGKPGVREFHALGTENKLAEAITEVDEQIKKYNESEAKRRWRAEGLAKFGEMLRASDSSLDALTSRLISGIVTYVGANQGGIFVHRDEEEEYLELVSCYAYSKVRIREKRVPLGQGMLGQCFLEKETMYILDVPENYVHITSGLGEATPANLVLVPLKLEERIFGVMELATFIPLDTHKIEFLELVAQNIASVLASRISMQNTEQLLADSQNLTVELQAREEEMRQNMEELSATQEEMDRKQAELDGVIGAINQTLGMAELSVNGEILMANRILEEIMESPETGLTGKTYKDLTGRSDSRKEFLQAISQRELESLDYRTTSLSGKLKWLSISFSPMLESSGITKKIMALVQDITDRKVKEMEFEKLSLVADNTNNSVIITDSEGRIEYINHGFTEMTGYAEEEVMGKKPGQFLQGPDTNKETVVRIREFLQLRMPIYEEILNYKKSGESYWISMAINPVFDDSGNLSKYISVQANITETKKNALDFRCKLEAISQSNAMIEFDLQGRITDVNDNFLKILGFAADELSGRTEEVILPQELLAEQEENWNLLRQGNYISDEFRRVKKNGETVWLRGIYNPILDLNHKPYKVVMFATDITREKAFMLETKEKGAELNSQMEAINKTIASVAFDMDGKLLSANDIFISVAGYEPEQLTSLHYSDLVPEKELAKPQTGLMWQNLREGKFFSGEFILKEKCGKELWMQGTFNAILDVTGRPYKVMMYAQFNTSEREKQKELSGISHALRKSAPTMEINPDGTFKNANPLFFSLFGYKRLELRQQPFRFFVDKQCKFDIKKVLREINDDEFLEYDICFRDAEGGSKNLHATFTAIRDLEDRLVKVVVILIEPKAVLKL